MLKYNLHRNKVQTLRRKCACENDIIKSKCSWGKVKIRPPSALWRATIVLLTLNLCPGVFTALCSLYLLDESVTTQHNPEQRPIKKVGARCLYLAGPRLPPLSSFPQNPGSSPAASSMSSLCDNQISVLQPLRHYGPSKYCYLIES